MKKEIKNTKGEKIIISGHQVKDITIQNSKFKNIDFTNLKFNNIKIINCKFTNCNFNNSTFDGVYIINSTYKGSLLLDTTFKSSNLTKNVFLDCKLNDIRVYNSILVANEFNSCNLNFGNFELSSIINNDFRLSTIKYCNFNKSKIIENKNFLPGIYHIKEFNPKTEIIMYMYGKEFTNSDIGSVFESDLSRCNKDEIERYYDERILTSLEGSIYLVNDYQSALFHAEREHCNIAKVSLNIEDITAIPYGSNGDYIRIKKFKLLEIIKMDY